jgi:hypothetical protein
MSDKTANILLKRAENRIRRQLTPDNRASHGKIVAAGISAALAQGPDGLMGSLRNSKDPIADCAKGAVSLVFVLRQTAQDAMPLKAMVPAAMTLMLKALNFVDRTGIAQVGNDELVRATHIFTNTMFAHLQISVDMLHHAAVKVHGVLQDPAAMQKVQVQAGTMKHPDAGRGVWAGASRHVVH